MLPILEVRQLTKQYKDSLAVDHVSFAIGEGEVVGLVGPNGAGKTTIIHMILS
ncbi:MAG: ATP-binding cassette domain-containing protein, partial [Candidatus Spechtbacterales bacterium]